MKDSETTIEQPVAARGGFQVSAEPVVGSRRSSARPPHPIDSVSELPVAAGTGGLHVLARDPGSLFVYWSADWPERFASAGLRERPAQLRVRREDGAEETTTPIDLMAGCVIVGVGSPEARYTCELGCTDGSAWKSLGRSQPAETPAAAISEDLATDFATIPFHLNFQRLIDVFRSSRAAKKSLAQSVSDLQTHAATAQEATPNADWSQLLESSTGAEPRPDRNALASSEWEAVLRTSNEESRRQAPSAEQFARWQSRGESFGGSSWSVGSSRAGGAGWGGSS